MGDAVRLRQRAYLDRLDRGLVLLRTFAIPHGKGA
jgi:hypothetical protein